MQEKYSVTNDVEQRKTQGIRPFQSRGYQNDNACYCNSGRLVIFSSQETHASTKKVIQMKQAYK